MPRRSEACENGDSAKKNDNDVAFAARGAWSSHTSNVSYALRRQAIRDVNPLAELTALSATGAPSAIGSAASPIWTASFVGIGIGKASITSQDAACAEVSVKSLSAQTLRFSWAGCAVRTQSASPPTNITWVEHRQSNCGGKCLAKTSKGPSGGHCDRMPGCGHDARLPYCKPEAMKARCLGATGCTSFNTNGYLYSGNAVVPFSAYPLSCWTSGPPPPPPGPPHLVDITLSISLNDGMRARAHMHS